MDPIISAYYLEHKGVFEENFRLVLDKFDVEAIHKMRTSTKRLRALFQLIEFLSDEKFKARKQLKKLRQVFKHAGRIREIQIESLLVKEYETKLDESYPAYLEYLTRREHKEIVAFLKSLPPIELRDQILNDEKILTVINNLNEHQLKDGANNFLRKKTAAILINIEKPPSNHRIHKNRTLLKQIYYLYPILDALTDVKAIIATDAERIREIEQYLGRWHDLVNSPVYLNAFLKTKSAGLKENYKALRNAIRTEREKMRKVILVQYFQELKSQIYTAK